MLLVLRHLSYQNGKCKCSGIFRLDDYFSSNAGGELCLSFIGHEGNNDFVGKG